jgi:hypothetical protein
MVEGGPGVQSDACGGAQATRWPVGLGRLPLSLGETPPARGLRDRIYFQERGGHCQGTQRGECAFAGRLGARGKSRALRSIGALQLVSLGGRQPPLLPLLTSSTFCTALGPAYTMD